MNERSDWMMTGLVNGPLPLLFCKLTRVYAVPFYVPPEHGMKTVYAFYLASTIDIRMDSYDAGLCYS